MGLIELIGPVGLIDLIDIMSPIDLLDLVDLMVLIDVIDLTDLREQLQRELMKEEADSDWGLSPLSLYPMIPDSNSNQSLFDIS